MKDFFYQWIYLMINGWIIYYNYHWILILYIYIYINNNKYDNYNNNFILKDPSEDAILAEGMIEYCEDLEVDPTDVIMLIIAYHLDSQNMCEFTRDCWMKGWTSLGYVYICYFL